MSSFPNKDAFLSVFRHLILFNSDSSFSIANGNPMEAILLDLVTINFNLRPPVDENTVAAIVVNNVVLDSNICTCPVQDNAMSSIPINLGFKHFSLCFIDPDTVMIVVRDVTSFNCDMSVAFDINPATKLSLAPGNDQIGQNNLDLFSLSSLHKNHREVFFEPLDNSFPVALQSEGFRDAQMFLPHAFSDVDNRLLWSSIDRRLNGGIVIGYGQRCRYPQGSNATNHNQQHEDKNAPMHHPSFHCTKLFYFQTPYSTNGAQ